MSLEQNRELQWESVKHMAQHAYDTVPFYRKRFADAGLVPSALVTPEDLEKIPALTREDLRNNLEDLWSRCYRREELRTAATGGTTDSPILLLRSPESEAEKLAIQFQFDAWAGMWPGDKVFYLWGARIDFVENPSWRWRLYDHYLMRRIWMPTSLFNEQILESYRTELNRFRPRIIYAYPTPLSMFCEFLRDSGRSFHRPETAICTAEPLLPNQRELIQEVLGCPVFERYATRDFGTIAGECEQRQGLHLNPAAAFVEFVPVQGAGVEGLHEIIVTDLLNFGMPLIRYKINDCTFLTSKTCSCGRGYPLMDQIVGRTMDNFLLSNGDVVPGISLQNRVIKICPGIKKLQIIQDTLCDFRVRFVSGPGFSEMDMKNLRERLNAYFGSSVNWTFEKTDKIERESSGKTRLCISHVSSGSRLDKAPQKSSASRARD
jgi:phenylacetate-CoA ligase